LLLGGAPVYSRTPSLFVAVHFDAVGDAGQAEHASVGEFEAPGAAFLDVNVNAQRAASISNASASSDRLRHVAI